MKLYWEGAQNAVEALVSDHLDITPLAVKEPIDSKKPLFRFDATAFASGTSTTDPSLQKVLPSCERVLELCQEVHGLIVSMDLYADRFAALWLLVLTDYNKNVTDMYERDILQRNERESEILIGNLATQKKIERAELLTDMSDVRALAALHESLRWFACEVRRLINSLPQHVKTNLRGCMVQVRYKDGQITDNEPVLDAMEDCICRLDSISDTCLLMLHLELRVHCFFHLLPLARPRNVSVHEELDAEV
ncbi:hypothetical protein TELCIR_04453 [Teladorsagia circumcincta]|uniref:Exocyst complex component Sec8 n=1 Tax=Teladorsagia circumcincta TaxID=45464 RepID=A0A2G9UTL1_TELCI|nr:hypothetical protein TELCIR_04453 [Teladorsagia circumcincta]